MHPPLDEQESQQRDNETAEQQQQQQQVETTATVAPTTKCEYKYAGFEIDWDLFCSLCGYPFVDAVVSNCGHSFCYNCVVDKETQQLREHLECPTDKINVWINVQNPTFNIVVNNMANKLWVHCKHQDGGCLWKGERKQLFTHSEQCEFRPATCINGCGKDGADFITEEEGGLLKTEICTGSPYQLISQNLDLHHLACARRILDCACGAGIPLYQMPEHLNLECPKQPTACRYCLQSVIRSELSKHCSDDCQGIPVYCEYRSYGCEFSSPRLPMADHIANDCTYHKMRGFLNHITGQVAGLKSDLEKMEERTTALENENSTLKQQLFLLQEKQRIAKNRANEEIEARTRERKDAFVTLKVLTQLTQTVQQLQLYVQQNCPQNPTKSVRHAAIQSYFEPFDKSKTLGPAHATTDNSPKDDDFDFGQFASFPFCNPPPSHKPLSSSTLRSSPSRLTNSSASSRSPLLPQSNPITIAPRPPSPSTTTSLSAPATSSSTWTAIFTEVPNQSTNTSLFGDCK
eukprot:TRINITY_DN275_c0_g2_i1.p1 TRINITY_DN275_c0_g2~~TRINITY_DN275_c0_g2_i1.p1  ORF type:complete len:517 (-),score=88.61 TRINITY_DN275_c0_g2_i1:121-1671(-)